MATVDLDVQQQGYEVGADGQSKELVGTRAGELYIASPQSLYDHWLRSGKVFETHVTDAGLSTIEANAAFDYTEPFFRFSVPSGKVVVPIKFKVSPATVWVTADAIALVAGDTNTVGSGGTAATARNMAVNTGTGTNLGASAVTSLLHGESVLTETAPTNPRFIDIHTFRTGGLFEPYEYNILKGDPMTMIEGPGAFLAYLMGSAIDVQIHAIWAELDNNELSNA